MLAVVPALKQRNSITFMNENNFQAADSSGRLDVGDQRDGGEGRRDVRVQREHPAQDQPHRRPRRQRDGNGGN